MRFKNIMKLFEQGNVCVCGERGRGKDMLFANVINRRKLEYVSNCPYPRKRGLQPLRHELDWEVLNCGGNIYKDFIHNTVTRFNYPYKRGVDIYITDVGVYMPSQFCNELNKDFKGVAAFMAISRQLGANVHLNVQNLNRIYDKMREQSRTYITCKWCRVLPFPKNHQLVIQQVVIYERAQACQDNVPPLKLPLSALIGKDAVMGRLYKLNYKIQHGEVKKRWLVYWNKSDYNTNIFEEILKVRERSGEYAQKVR